MATIYCPKCGKPNPAEIRFCQHCGQPVAELRNYPQAPAVTTQAGVPLPAEQRVSTSPPMPQTQTIGQMGQGGLSVLDIWGPFAGYGDRRRHVSWLLDNQGNRAEDLREAVMHRFQERQVPGGKVRPMVLTGKGIAVERRPFYLIQRGVATAGLYLARFGQDLYISQVTYAKGPISPLRVLVFIISIIFELYVLFGYSQALQSSLESVFGSLGILSGFSPDLDRLRNLLCVVGPLGLLNSLALLIAGVHMAYKFLTVRDPFMLLRTPPNEFQQDDIVALEKAVEETVRQSLDRIGIDAELMPPASDYGAKGRLF